MGMTMDEWLLENPGGRKVTTIARPHSKDILVIAKYGGGTPRIAQGVGPDSETAWGECFEHIKQGGTFCRSGDYSAGPSY